MKQVMFNCPITGRTVATGISETRLSECKDMTHRCHPECPDGQHRGTELEFYLADPA
jgi:hypothetical protein